MAFRYPLWFSFAYLLVMLPVVLVGVLVGLGFPSATFWLQPVGLLFAAITLLGFTLGMLGLALPVMSLTTEGITWYGLWRLPWTEAKAVRSTSVLGLRYLVVSRVRGLPWWLPLFVRGPISIQQAIGRFAPSGSPLHTYVTAT